MAEEVMVAPELVVNKGFFQKLNDDIDDLHKEGKISVNGRSFITHLTSMYWGCRGIPEVMFDTALPVVLFNILDVPSKEGAILQALIWTPWAMKPFFAIISDLFPMGYYKKRWYMMGVALMGASAGVAIYLSTPEQLGLKTADTAFIYFFLVNVAISMCDSLSQGKYTEICKWKGSTVVSYVSGSKTAGGTIASLIGPTLNDGGGFLAPIIGVTTAQTTMAVTAPFLGQAAAVFGMNFMGDRPHNKCCDFDKSIWLKDYKIILTGLGLAGVALSITCIQVVNRFVEVDLSVVLLPYCTLGLVGILVMTYWSLPNAIAKINTYIIFCRIGQIDFRYVLQQFYTAPRAQCGDINPHFPNMVYQMVGLVTANLMTLFGVYLFENYVYYWNARRAFWVTTVFTMFAAMFDLAMVTQFNRVLWSWLPVMSGYVTWFCTPDEKDPGNFVNCEPEGYRLDDLFGFLMGSQGIKYIATTLDDMPSTILLSKLCPAGVETTVFAMLAALMNLGLTFAGLLAGQFAELYKINIDSNDVNQTFFNETAGENQTRLVTEYDCNLGYTFHWPHMEGLPWGIIVGGMIMPALTIPATFCFIPNIRLSDKFVEEETPETEMTEAGDAAGVHPAAAFGRVSPSFDPLSNPQLAPAEELERASFLSFDRRGGALSTSRIM